VATPLMAAPSVLIVSWIRATGGDVVKDEVIGAASRGAALVVVKAMLCCVTAAVVVGAGVVVAVVGGVSYVADEVVDAIKLLQMIDFV
jgi:hypothetical protein